MCDPRSAVAHGSDSLPWPPSFGELRAMSFVSGLPIDAVLGDLAAALAARTEAVLVAPPGAGKTTVVPLALREAPWLAGERLVMLEPRRLAARAAAYRMAALLGEEVGATVGYRTRLDSRVGPRTRVEVVTEGILTRLLQRDPTLEGYALVVFDEFHERSLHADTALALARQTQQLVRPELRLLVMSATLDGAAVARHLGDAPLVTSAGRQFPVETRYRSPARVAGRPAALERAVAGAVRAALDGDPGDLLVFLPGAPEIRRVAELLRDPPLPAAVDVIALHGLLAPNEQDRAIRPSPAGRRKVVLATAIAETSLTIDGVRVVVDSGLARRPRFSPRTGMTRLETMRVSRAAADQRRGRAARVAPGVCYRLWDDAEEAALLPSAPPEILEADLAPLALDLAAAGVADPLALTWLDPPPAAAFAQARELLRELSALDAAGRLTAHGRAMARLALHPRLAHMVLRAHEEGLGALACDLAALLSERDVLRSSGTAGSDVRVRLDVLRDGARSDHAGTDRAAIERARTQAAQWRHVIGAPPAAADARTHAGRVLALAYPDRVAQRRRGPAPRFLQRNGTGVFVAPDDPLGIEPFLVVAESDGRAPESRVFLAAPLSLDDVEHDFTAQVTTEERIEWSDETGVRAHRLRRLGAITLAEQRLDTPDPAMVAAALAAEARRRGLGLLPWTERARRLRERLAFLHELDSSWPDVADEVLAAPLFERLVHQLGTVRSAADLRRVDVHDALLGLLPWPQRARLDELAPTHFTAPTGARHAIDYVDPQAPSVSVRLQELFGLTDTPRVGGGRIPLTLRLLSPAQRPVQVTRDLAGFWRASYFDVRKDLRARYPKHEWPDDPLKAAPTRRAKRPGS